MAEYSGLMYAVGTPLQVYPLPKPKQDKKDKQRQQSNSSSSQPGGATTAQHSRSHNPFRHSRSSSSSQASRSSHETVSPLPHPHPDHPAGGVVGESSSSQQTTPRPSSQPATTTEAARASASAGPITRTGSGAVVPPSSPPPPGSSGASIYSFASRQPGERRSSNTTRGRHRPNNTQALSALDLKNVVMYSEQEAGKPPSSTKQMNLSFGRTESVSSTSGQTSTSTPTMTSTDPSASGDLSSKPFVVRSGRTYLNDGTLPYPLPSDLTELHRQSLRTLLLIQVFGAPVCSPAATTKPPQRVLEIGCGSGFWSMMCHRYFKGRGHGGISFTGIDIAPLAPPGGGGGGGSSAGDSTRPDRDMKWKFINHDLRQFPWPLQDEEYDLVMVKDMSLAATNAQHQAFIDEYLRVLRPGGTMEIWESDHTIRMLRPHVPAAAATATHGGGGGGGGDDAADEHEVASGLGAYIMSANTPLSPPVNAYLVEYNTWVTRALEARDLSAVPCTLLGPTLLQEAESLTDVRSRRLAIPLSEVRWEREGVGGVVTKDGKSYVETKARSAPHQRVEKKTLSAGQAALRRTALLTVVQQVQALEPVLREVSGKSLDEWDVWLGKMMADMMSDSGTTGPKWGECLEVGAWWAKKIKA